MEQPVPMEGVTHRIIPVNGINLHVAEKGEGPVVLLLHGFPELWYSWRHQITGLAAHGYRVVAPDLRGYGDSDVPSDIPSYTMLHLVGDIVGLIDALGQEQVFLVGHDWGAIVAWSVCLLRPDKVKALVNLSVPFKLWDHQQKPLEFFRSRLSDDFYICRFQEPGVVEAELGSISNESIIKQFYTHRDPNPLIVPKNPGFGFVPSHEIVLPPWLTKEDVAYFASKFDKTGYFGPLNYYRNLDKNMELMAAWKGAKVGVPAKFIMGELDLTYNFPGVRDYLHNGGFKEDVPLLEDVVILEGAAHFINQEKAHEITHYIHDFISKF